MRAAWSRASRALPLLLALLALWLPRSAEAGKRSMIPPGQEQRIRELVDAALTAARDAHELPVAIDERTSISIDRDRIRVVLHPLDALDTLDTLDPPPEPLPRLLVFHPEALDAGVAIVPGIALECGTPTNPGPCSEAIASAWTPTARRLADAREPWVDVIWQIEESGVQAREPRPTRRSSAAVWLDRSAAILAVVLGLGLLATSRLERRRSEGDPPRPSAAELLALLGLLVAFVSVTAMFTSMLPLHEHNSFIARSDCAIDERCTSDPAAAWAMTTLHGYGLLLALIPYRASTVGWLSLGLSALSLVLLWALVRRLWSELFDARHAATAGLAAVAVLVSNPIFWRLSGAATFWPWSTCWTLAAALAGSWAARSCASEQPKLRRAGVVAWLLAALCLAFAAASNFVCLTLGACLLLAPACWSRARVATALGRAAWLGPLALAGFALLVAPDYLDGLARASGPESFGDSLTVKRMITDFDPLLLDPQLVTPVWALIGAAALLLGLAQRLRSRSRDPAELGRALRRLLPLVYAYVVPAACLGVAAGELVGSGYPVGFINHHWELVFTAIAVGFALAYLVSTLERLRPRAGRLTWAQLLLAGSTAAALLLAPLAGEGWRMATGERVLERELLALERSFAHLPEHDRLVVAPRVLAPLTDAPSQWDPLEVVFPVGFYQHALRERGLEPGLVVSMDRLLPPRPGERMLVYVGSSLRSFQPHEIAANVVPEQLERPELVRLRDAWTLEPVQEFVLPTEQHRAISQRLAADRAGEVELGFYWLRARR